MARVGFFNGTESRALDDWHVVSIVAHLGEQLAHLHLNQLDHLFVGSIHLRVAVILDLKIFLIYHDL